MGEKDGIYKMDLQSTSYRKTIDKRAHITKSNDDRPLGVFFIFLSVFLKINSIACLLHHRRWRLSNNYRDPFPTLYIIIIKMCYWRLHQRRVYNIVYGAIALCIYISVYIVHAVCILL